MVHYHTDIEITRLAAETSGPILFLGDQLINLAEVQAEAGVFARDYYAQLLKREVEDIDLEGGTAGGAIHTHDLSTTISKRAGLHERFGLIVDCGTLEHVEGGLAQALRNVFNFLAPGGIAFHANPAKGMFPGHGQYKFDDAFWRAYCELAGLHLVELYQQAAYHNYETGVEQYAAYRKREQSKLPKVGDIEALIAKHELLPK